jgi:hypothetical protein
MDRADPDAGQHREHGLGDHRQVDQHPVAASHAQPLQARREAVHFLMQLPERVRLFDVDLGGHIDQRGLLAARGQVPVDRVVAQIGRAADEPARERRARVVQHPRKRALPVDQPGFFGPERVRRADRLI